MLQCRVMYKTIRTEESGEREEEAECVGPLAAVEVVEGLHGRALGQVVAPATVQLVRLSTGFEHQRCNRL